MTNIYYPSEESLGHLDGTRTINSILWKFLYKRVQKRLEKSIINIENMRKIVFNKKLLLQCKIDSDLPFVILRREPSWYYAEDGEEYLIPFSICFMDGKRKYDIVLVDGKIDLRDDSKRGENLNNRLSHTPVLLVKIFKNIENSFEVLLAYIKKEEEI
ncbi:MAG: hypothetical protein ACNI28_00635 [Arcobacter sp.]|uniref:hypothetical protein n=1 Tax=Arcobacter sp. TaxID=1872629 RepID=UPI003AFFA673